MRVGAPRGQAGAASADMIHPAGGQPPLDRSAPMPHHAAMPGAPDSLPQNPTPVPRKASPARTPEELRRAGLDYVRRMRIYAR